MSVSETNAETPTARAARVAGEARGSRATGSRSVPQADAADAAPQAEADASPPTNQADASRPAFSQQSWSPSEWDMWNHDHMWDSASQMNSGYVEYTQDDWDEWRANKSVDSAHAAGRQRWRGGAPPEVPTFSDAPQSDAEAFKKYEKAVRSWQLLAKPYLPPAEMGLRMYNKLVDPKDKGNRNDVAEELNDFEPEDFSCLSDSGYHFLALLFTVIERGAKWPEDHCKARMSFLSKLLGNN